MSQLVYATSAAVVEKTFSDSQCTIPAGGRIIPYTGGPYTVRKCYPFGVIIYESGITSSDIGGVTIR